VSAGHKASSAGAFTAGKRVYVVIEQPMSTETAPARPTKRFGQIVFMPSHRRFVPAGCVPRCRWRCVVQPFDAHDAPAEDALGAHPVGDEAEDGIGCDPGTSMAGPIETFLTADHARIDALLAKAERPDGTIDAEVYAEFRQGLLRHIAMEEKILLPYAIASPWWRRSQLATSRMRN
jgi:hypothetical protein